MSADIEAFSERTGKMYPTFDLLVEAEANGYAVVGVSTAPNTAPAVYGPYPTKSEARRAAARLRNRWKREEATSYPFSVYVRVLWKEDR